MVFDVEIAAHRLTFDSYILSCLLASFSAVPQQDRDVEETATR